MRMGFILTGPAPLSLRSQLVQLALVAAAHAGSVTVLGYGPPKALSIPKYMTAAMAAAPARGGKILLGPMSVMVQ